MKECIQKKSEMLRNQKISSSADMVSEHASRACIFCKIVKGDIPSARVYEDEKFIAFLDIMPVNKGHILVIPKRHYETVIELPEQNLKEIISLTKRLALALSHSIAPDGFNIMCNNRKAAGQEIPHLHFHLIPRYHDDGHAFTWDTERYKQGEMQELKEKIVKFL